MWLQGIRETLGSIGSNNALLQPRWALENIWKLSLLRDCRLQTMKNLMPRVADEINKAGGAPLKGPIAEEILHFFEERGKKVRCVRVVTSDFLSSMSDLERQLSMGHFESVFITVHTQGTLTVNDELWLDVGRGVHERLDEVSLVQCHCLRAIFTVLRLSLCYKWLLVVINKIC